MRRRDLIAMLGCAVAWPLVARGQQRAMPLIGYLSTIPRSTFSEGNVAAVRQGLNEAGYVEGKNLAIEYRWADGDYGRLPALAAELVGLKVDVIVAGGGSISAGAAKAATSTIPIVFTSSGDPVGAGLVASLARPGGNVTGVSIITSDLPPKLLELLNALVPQAGATAYLVNPTSPIYGRVVADVQEAARTKGIQLLVQNASNENEIDAAFAKLVQLHAGAILVDSDAFFTGRREQIVTLTSRYKLPAIYAFRVYTDNGGLMSYGPSITAAYRQAGVYAGRILAGAKPADLPVQQPTTFELVINLKTAKALGLTVPPSLLLQANQVIE